MTKMITTSFDTFIKTHASGNSKPITHTRIADKTLKIYGGAYHISDADNVSFLETYYQKVFVDETPEYITEKQLIENGPLLVDIDLHYDTQVTERKHTEDYIIDLIALYLDKINLYVDVDINTQIDIFVLEKKNINKLPDKTKDGIHLIFGLQVHKAIQIMIRDKIVREIATIWDDLPIINTWDQVVDEGVVRGHVNWQLFGSRKPGHEAYEICKHYTSTFTKEWSSPYEQPLPIINSSQQIEQLSARYKGHPASQVKANVQSEFETISSGLQRKPRRKLEITTTSITLILQTGRFDKINDEATLDKIIESMLEQINPADYRIRETHEYTMALPISYYGRGSYNKWLRVGWALANTSHKLFVSWLKMSSQENGRNSLSRGGKFDWENSVKVMYELWKTFDCSGSPDGLSHRSIMYWCKKDALDKYEGIRKHTIDYFIDQTTIDTNEFDLASVLFNIFKDRFVCVSIKNKCWYEYINHRWFEIDSGSSLRLCISKEMHFEYLTRIHDLTTAMQTMEQNDTQYEAMRKKTSKLADLAVLLKKTHWKNNIMREACELFYDKDFLNKLDHNPYLLCFNNGVIDFKERKHRPGQPDDYISKCTNIDYIPITSNETVIVQRVNTFMEELFPNKELRKYMWEHLASVLVGTLDNQTFNIYLGPGRNGKSCLVDLMSAVLGNYKETVPTCMITQNRTSIGSTSSEIVKLMGVRYAVMQEPKKGECINEGIMKEITGGDPIQGRALYKDTVTFIPQFKLVVTTNVLFDIKSNDDGTWRRIRVCDFASKFLENPYADDNFPKEQFPYQFPLDKQLKEKFKLWAPVFASLLVSLAFETQGNVKDCKVVMASGSNYRDGQDYITEFAKEKIMKCNDSKIQKSELMQTFKEWYQINYGGAVPKAREIYDYMNNRYGIYKKGGWYNLKIIYDEEEFDNIDM